METGITVLKLYQGEARYKLNGYDGKFVTVRLARRDDDGAFVLEIWSHRDNPGVHLMTHGESVFHDADAAEFYFGVEVSKLRAPDYWGGR